MSSPFTYTPEPHYTAFSPQTPNYSPFIPDFSAFPASPFRLPSSLPASPQSQPVPLPPSANPQNVFLNINVDKEPKRPRTVSWSGPGTPFVPPPFLGSSLSSTSSSTQSPAHARRRSDSFKATPSAVPSNWPQPYPIVVSSPAAPIPVRLHPWLYVQQKDLHFNLAQNTFYPNKHVSHGQWVALTHQELYAAATDPPVSQMKITIDRLPQWPITISYNPYAEDGGLLSVPGVSPTSLPPLSLGDVLGLVHRRLHQRITHRDWESLPKSDQDLVAKAFNRRCISALPGEPNWRADGVHRVDFLVDHILFKGLVPKGPDTYELVTGNIK